MKTTEIEWFDCKLTPEDEARIKKAEADLKWLFGVFGIPADALTNPPPAK